MFISSGEIISMAIITSVLGYIFMDMIFPPASHYLIVARNKLKEWAFAAALIGPAIIVHELFHKFAAMSFGLPATFKVFWAGLGLALILKLLHSPLLILAPAYVVFPATVSPLSNAIIAFAGPFANLAMWMGAGLWLKHGRMRRQTAVMLAITKQVNKFLFIFNLIPIPPLDGFQVASGIIGAIF